MNSWFSDAIVYHILIDRFAGYRSDCDATKPEFCGGNIKSIADKIGYLKNLGINTIWISPFYETFGYHGYHITNFDKIDARFGTESDLFELIRKCHENHLKIIADIVPNHCSIRHPWFIDAIKNRESKYHDWFYFEKWPYSYLRFLEFNELPKINLENSEAAQQMIRSIKRWANMGFDGFRIDHVLGIPDNFLKQLRFELLKIKPDSVLIGEAWAEGIRQKHIKTLKFKGKYSLWAKKFDQISIQKHYEGMLDAVLDFGWRDLVIQNLNILSKKIVEFKIKEDDYNKNYYGSTLILPRFLDNHDVGRIMFLCRNNKKLFSNVLKLLSEQNQPVILYYGTEFGLTHSHDVSPEKPYSDLQSRNIIPWQNEAVYYTLLAELFRKRIRK